VPYGRPEHNREFLIEEVTLRDEVIFSLNKENVLLTPDP